MSFKSAQPKGEWRRHHASAVFDCRASDSRCWPWSFSISEEHSIMAACHVLILAVFFVAVVSAQSSCVFPGSSLSLQLYDMATFATCIHGVPFNATEAKLTLSTLQLSYIINNILYIKFGAWEANPVDDDSSNRVARLFPPTPFTAIESLIIISLYLSRKSNFIYSCCCSRGLGCT